MAIIAMTRGDVCQICCRVPGDSVHWRVATRFSFPGAAM
ncbi:hypothetical protein XCR_2965 [Xanthomonas campestris pv. raphani 756C]|nr:hypothetical protein XCR_2965 [Xanthomonas campestris pv. raphani 756C]